VETLASTFSKESINLGILNSPSVASSLSRSARYAKKSTATLSRYNTESGVSFLGNPKKKMIYIKPKNVAAGVAQHFWDQLFCVSPLE
jgi:hypothetical protein